MPKKTTTKKAAVAVKRPAKPAAKATAKAPSNGVASAPAATTPPKKTKPAAKTPATKAKTLKYTLDDVARRAYYIAEKRQNLGLPGDAKSDWIEAERQLVSETSAKAKAGAA